MTSDSATQARAALAHFKKSLYPFKYTVGLVLSVSRSSCTCIKVQIFASNKLTRVAIFVFVFFLFFFCFLFFTPVQVQLSVNAPLTEQPQKWESDVRRGGTYGREMMSSRTRRVDRSRIHEEEEVGRFPGNEHATKTFMLWLFIHKSGMNHVLKCLFIHENHQKIQLAHQLTESIW